MQPIFHIVAVPEWQAACELGRYAPESLASEGFIHFSFEHQVALVANRLYRGRANLIVVEIDPAALPEPIVLEDLYDADEEFPHVYGAIPTSAEIARHPLNTDSDGRFVFAARSS
ncbi:MAG TPA: DUF952 domain-containing protein [Jatrophihabitans sp.]|jgi:uncharacterized protein (DUF952 family)